MEKAIKDFPKQLEFEPTVENAENLKSAGKFAVCGMGGSHLAADLIKTARSDLDLITHSNYGLPEAKDLDERLIIVNSYSGNTEEALDSFDEAVKVGLDLAAISIGGKLLEKAKKQGVAFGKIPDTGIQPRVAVGFSVLALLKLMGEEAEIAEIKKVAGEFGKEEERGRELAKKLEGKVPVIYTSGKNGTLAANWKIKFNETGKIPAFWNVFSELNHNEMTGWDAVEKSKTISQNFAFIFLRDKEDRQRIIKRMDITEKLLKEKEFETVNVEIAGSSAWHKIFSSLLTADWTAYYLALHYGAEPEQVPMVEEFKKMMV